jgi:hypothetical protein
VIIGHLLNCPRRITRAPPTTDGEILLVVLLIADLVSKSVPYVLLLPVQKKDPAPNPLVHCMSSSFISSSSFYRHDHSLGEDPLPGRLEWVLA